MKIPLTNQEIFDHWKNEPATLLEILHAFQERDGWLSENVLCEVSDLLRYPLAELYGTVSFYDYFNTSPSCQGKGDQSTPVFKVCREANLFDEIPIALPPENPDDYEECVFKNIRRPGISDIKTFQKYKGYSAFKNALAEEYPEKILLTITQSGLRGRGGAGFPTGEKWRQVSTEERGPKTIVCNADEGEPGCFKDRALLYYNPHQVIEGMCIAALATGATRGFIYLRFEYPEVFQVLKKALREAQDAGLLGNQIRGTKFSFQLYIRRGAGAYICGEEGALLNSLEGKHPFTRNKPPFPATHGFENLPTVVNNVETLAAVSHILNKGSKWYRSLGLADNEGTKLISLSGDIKRPGNYEVPLGLPLKTLLYDWAGGLPEGRSIQLVTMAGVSGGFLALDDMDVCLDEQSIRKNGSFLGAGGIIVLDDSRDPVEFTTCVMEFFTHESCGKCVPCRSGTRILSDILKTMKNNTGFMPDGGKIEQISQTMMATSACGLGMAAPNIIMSLRKYFPERLNVTH